MTMSNSVPKPNIPDTTEKRRILATPEMIDRLATEMRARTGGELPHSFYVEQVKRQLGDRLVETIAANDEPKQAKPKEDDPCSVFHAWALPE